MFSLSKHKDGNVLTFTANADRVLDSLRTKCTVVAGGKRKKVIALWDTGSTATCISKRLARELRLPVVGKWDMYSTLMKTTMKSHRVSIMLPNGAFVENIEVVACSMKRCDILVGMDIIGLGTFSVSNVGGKTSFSFSASVV